MLFEILFSFNSPCPYGWAIVITLRLSSFVSVSFWYFILFLRNLWADCIQTWQRCCLCGCLWKTFMWKKLEMWLNTNSVWMIIGLSVTKCTFLLWIENLRWPWTVGQNHRTLFVWKSLNHLKGRWPWPFFASSCIKITFRYWLIGPQI